MENESSEKDWRLWPPARHQWQDQSELVIFLSWLVDAVMHTVGWHLFDGVPWFEGMMASCFKSIGTANK